MNDSVVRVELTRFSFEVEGLSLPEHGAAGVGNEKHTETRFRADAKPIGPVRRKVNLPARLLWKMPAPGS